MVQALLEDSAVDINDEKTYDNGKKIVPSYLLKPISVHIENYEEVLIDSGYYTEDDLK